MPLIPKQEPPYYQIASNTDGTTRYKAFITQEDIDPPVLTILENTIGNIVWTRSFAGRYVGTLTGAFATNTTTILISPLQDENANVTFRVNNADTIYLQTYDLQAGAYVQADYMLFDTYIEIIIYP